jgi:hypothetical protein
MGIKLACFDMDDTILNGDLHYALREAGVPIGTLDMEKLPGCVEKLGGVKNRQALLATMRSLMKSGVHVAVTSFSEDILSIPYVLKQVGLTDREIAQIQIVSFHPSKEEKEKNGKNNHIQRVIDSYPGENIQPQEVVLVDDNLNNFELAKKHGYNVIWVQGSEGKVDYLNELRALAGLSAPETALPVPEKLPAPLPEQSFVEKLLSSIGLGGLFTSAPAR